MRSNCVTILNTAKTEVFWLIFQLLKMTITTNTGMNVKERLIKEIVWIEFISQWLREVCYDW